MLPTVHSDRMSRKPLEISERQPYSLVDIKMLFHEMEQLDIHVAIGVLSTHTMLLERYSGPTSNL